jgi:predicted amidophosphoribosyltransferase
MKEKTIPINPIKIVGNWAAGWALDYHTVSSKYDKAGRYYITDRTRLGEALYKFKYRRYFWLAKKIAETASEFLENMKVAREIDLIITIPPAEFRLFYQPVKILGKRIGRILCKPVETKLIKRQKKIPPVKSIEDRCDRLKSVKGLFSVKTKKIYGKTALLFDDLYRSGATLREAAKVLKSEGNLDKIYVLTITRTRVRK